eukprot:4202636-Pyramimonas_sp.AAC.1
MMVPSLIRWLHVAASGLATRSVVSPRGVAVQILPCKFSQLNATTGAWHSDRGCISAMHRRLWRCAREC